MTIRDIAVAFGFEVDRNSEARAEESIKGLKSFANKMLGKIALVFSVSKLSEFTKDCLQAGSNVQEMENKFNTVFGKLSEEVDKWADDFANAVGRNKNSIKTYLADQQNLLVGFGMSREEGAKLSKEMTSLALDIASFANMDEDQAVERMTKAVMGESESAKGLGAVLNETTRAETMRALGMKGSYDSLSQLKKMQVNYNTILRQSPDAVGDCVRSMDSYESRTRQLKSTIENFKEFIGSKLIPVFSVLIGWLNNLMKGVTNFAKAVFGATDDNNKLLKVFEKMQGTLQHLKPTFDRIGETIGKAFKIAWDIITKVSSVIGKVLLGAVDKALTWFDKLSNFLGGMENTFKILAVAVGAFILVNKWSKIVLGALKFAGALGKVWNWIKSINLKTLGIIALIVILALLVEDFINFMQGNDSVIGELFDKAGIGADNARDAIKKAWQTVKDFLFEQWENIKTMAEDTWNAIKDFFVNNADTIKEDVLKAWDILAEGLGIIWDIISDFFDDGSDNKAGENLKPDGSIVSTWKSVLDAVTSVFQAIFDIIHPIVTAILALIKSVIGLIKPLWAIFGNTIVSYFRDAWNNIKTIIMAVINFVKNFCDMISNLLNGNFAAAWESLKGMFVNLWQFISGILSQLWNDIKTYVMLIWLTVKTVVTVAWNVIKTIFTAIWNHIRAVFISIATFAISSWNAIKSAITTAITAIKSKVSSIFNSIKSFIVNIFTNIKSAISSKISAIKTTIINGLKGAVNYIKKLPSEAIKWGKDMIDGLVKGIKASIGKVGDAVKGVGKKIKSVLHFSVPDEGPLTDYESWMPDFMSGLAKGINDNKDTLINQVKDVAQGMSIIMNGATATSKSAGMVNNSIRRINQKVNINNSYSGTMEAIGSKIPRTMNQSAIDATTQLARGLQYSRG